MIELLSLEQTGQAVITLAVVVGMFVLFMREAFPTEVVAILGVAVLLALGVLPYQAAVDVLANPFIFDLDKAEYAMPATPEQSVFQTFCGT